MEHKNKSHLGKNDYFRFLNDLKGPGPGIEIVNKEALIAPGMVAFARPIGRYGFHDFPVRPRLKYFPKEGAMPKDFEIVSSYFIVSRRFKDLVQSVDPDSMDFVLCDFVLPDGTSGPEYYLADVVREINALDQEKSNLKTFMDGDRKRYDIVSARAIYFNDSLVGNSHIFRQQGLIGFFCDNSVREMLLNEEVKGIRFFNTKRLK